VIRAQQAALQNHQLDARILQLLQTMAESCAGTRDFPCGAENEQGFPLSASFFLEQIAVVTSRCRHISYKTTQINA